MNDISVKSIGCLIDELCTTSQKLFGLQDKMSADRTGDISGLARELMSLNARRTALIRAIDHRMGEEQISNTNKTYT